jgi:Domain of Unknown Function (DUF1080)
MQNASWALCFLSHVVIGFTAFTAYSQENNQPPAGFVALFNGRDIDAWTGATTRDPREIAALSPAEHHAFLAKMKTEIARHWRVENGVLVSDGREPYLATRSEYGDFELWVDWQLGPLGDSGIYLRGVPQVQIWDYTNAAKFDRGADKGSGGLWNNTKHERFPKQVADAPIGQWNRMFIRMAGQFVTVTLNNKTVVENEIFENYFDHARPIFMRGPIYLQTHGAETRFRNIFIRELSPSESHQQLVKMRSEDGFQSLFNGHDLSGWIGAGADYRVVDGAIVCRPGREGNLVTKDMYANFVARLEFKLPPGGNNGLAIHTPTPEAVATYEGIELQILDSEAPQYAGLEPFQYHGSVYGLVPAVRGYLRPTGEWNDQEVTVKGDHVEVLLNGFQILNTNLDAARRKPLDGLKHPGAFRTTGYFGFCGHGDPVAFRNISIKRLP